MKNKSMSMFFLYLVFFNLLLISSKTHHKISSVTKNGHFQGYYWIQRFYPGNDAIDMIKESEFHSRQMFINLNKEMIFFSKSLERIEDVEDSITLDDLFDSKNDDLKSGKCCYRITYNHFPPEKGLKNILLAVAKNTKKGPPKIKSNTTPACSSNNPLSSESKSDKARKQSKQSPKLAANFCIDLYVPEEARWRICSSSQDKILKLQMNLILNIITKKLNGKANLISNIMTNIKTTKDISSKDWSWDNQNKWKDFCHSEFMPSPININKQSAVKPRGINFGISHHLLPVNTMIKRNSKEVIVAFLNFGGLFQLTINNTYLLFTPVYMSFRFPGEHLLNGQRKMGELLIHFVENAGQRKNTVTNGLILSIPLQATKDSLDIKSFENLNIDFWKYELEKHGTYIPKRFLGKKLLTFDLPEIIKKVTDMKPNYFLYLGSHTTPPCNEQTYHLVVDRPIAIAACQFNLLRDHSLFTRKAKVIHTREEKPIGDRTVYMISPGQFALQPNIDGLIPQSFNKYLVQHGYGYKSRNQAKKLNPRQKLLAGPNDEWLDDLNCNVPKN